MGSRIRLIPFLMLILFSACVNTKKITYFNDLSKANGTDSLNRMQQLRVQPGDVLQITITTIDKDVSMLFNPIQFSATGAPGVSMEPGYLVDSSGHISIPFAGKIYVKDQTTAGINELVSKALESTIKNAYVSTRLANFRVSVIGDVAHPGSYKVAAERATILDVLSMAGDMNTTAKRSDIMIIREVNGIKTYTSLNMNDSKVFSSPYYYLNNNDVVYVKPGGDKLFNNSKVLQLMPAVLGVVSLITTLIIVNK